jgi:GxxExxY protein
MKEPEDSLSYSVIGMAMSAHSALGPGLAERFYQRHIGVLLTRSDQHYELKPRRQLIHRGILADIFEPDMVVADDLIADLKVLKGAFHPEHFIQLTSYLKAWRFDRGLLLDFGKERLMVKRFCFTERPPTLPDRNGLLAALPHAVQDRDLALGILDSLLRILATYGLGYRDKTYRGLVRADLLSDGYRCLEDPLAEIRCDGHNLGQMQLECLAVENAIAVMCYSLREEIRAADRAIMQTKLKHLGLSCGIIAHFGKEKLDIRWVTYFD